MFVIIKMVLLIRKGNNVESKKMFDKIVILCYNVSNFIEMALCI